MYLRQLMAKINRPYSLTLSRIPCRISGGMDDKRSCVELCCCGNAVEPGWFLGADFEVRVVLFPAIVVIEVIEQEGYIWM